MGDPTPADFAAIMKTLGEAAQSQADAASSLATAEKTRADADKVRQEVALATAQQSTAFDSAKADLETKRLANQKTEQDNQADRIDKMVTWATAAVPDVSALQKNSLTVSTGTVLFEGQQLAKALRLAAQNIAGALSTKLAEKTVYVTADATIFTSIAKYLQIQSEADVVLSAIEDPTDGLITAINKIVPRTPTVPVDAERFFGPVDVVAVAAGVTGALASQAAALFEVDVAATVERSDVDALDLQVSVINELLTLSTDLDIRHQFARVPSGDSALRSTIKTLQTRDLELARLTQKLDDYVTALGDPSTGLAKIDKVLQGKVSATEKQALEKQRAQLAAAVQTLADAKAVQSDAKAVIDKLHDFVSRLAAADEHTGLSPFQQALSVEGMVDGESVVLVLPPSTAESTQITVTRRLFWPRLINETTVTAKYIAVTGERIIAADQITARVHDRVRLKWTDTATDSFAGIMGAASKPGAPTT